MKVNWRFRWSPYPRRDPMGRVEGPMLRKKMGRLRLMMLEGRIADEPFLTQFSIEGINYLNLLFRINYNFSYLKLLFIIIYNFFDFYKFVLSSPFPCDKAEIRTPP
jgi:hypothetical protein